MYVHTVWLPLTKKLFIKATELKYISRGRGKTCAKNFELIGGNPLKLVSRKHDEKLERIQSFVLGRNWNGFG